MLSVILLYWIGKYFYKLADEYNKSKWGYGILGIVIFYAGFFLFGFGIIFIAEVVSEGSTDIFSDTLLGFIMMPFGVLSCYVLYKYLEKTWNKNDPRKNNMIDQIGKQEN
ncbi:hypothetical protein [Polaribacter sp. R77954]|uniref:hypothetical protein n=1 Tax=Polaribacter sp. R77954 TaxID=3093870 RepID=UPI0037CB83A7